MLTLGIFTFNRQITRQKLWFLIAIIYGGIVANTAANERAYVYDGKHYENVLNGMNSETKDIYYRQDCNSLDLSTGAPEPKCFSLTTIDDGSMKFDITTPRSVADKVIKEYNEIAYKYVVVTMLRFYSFFALLWLIPIVIFYPFFEWFLDGYTKDHKIGTSIISPHAADGVAVNKLEKFLKQYFAYLENKGKIFNLALGIGFAIFFGILDISTPIKYSFIMAYIFPIALTTWFAGQSAGYLITVICVLFWSHTNQQNDLIAFSCNIFSTISIYFIISIMITRLRRMWEEESVLSRTDQLTGAMNRRAFEEFVEYEILSLQRQNSPFSLAYLDLDNFKEVNDTYGHKKGDELLKSVVGCLKDNLRRTDVVARIGGDEFTIFFPSTDQVAVKIVIQKLQEQLSALNKRNNWPTTISIGVITSVDSKCDLETTISLADKLMYEVKNHGKDDVNYTTISLEM